MEKKNDGGSAFPTSGQNGSVTYDADGRAIHRPFISAQPEMSLRDYFAGQALAGLVLHPMIDHGDVQSHAYAIADAMLREREK